MNEQPFLLAHVSSIRMNELGSPLVGRSRWLLVLLRLLDLVRRRRR